MNTDISYTIFFFLAVKQNNYRRNFSIKYRSLFHFILVPIDQEILKKKKKKTGEKDVKRLI